MKKIDTTIGTDPDDQQPFTAPSLLFLQQSYQEVIDAISKALVIDATKVTILFGCIHSGTNNISAGAVYTNGEVYLTDAVSLGAGVVIANLVITNPAPDPITFEGGATHNVHNVRKAAWVLGTTGTGTLTGNANSDYNNALDHHFHAVGTSGEPAFNSAWINNASGGLNFNLGNDGRVYLQGSIKRSNATVGEASPIFTIPVKYRPSNDTYLIGNYFSNTDGFHHSYTLQIISGVVTPYGNEGITIPQFNALQDFLSLDGLSYQLLNP